MRWMKDRIILCLLSLSTVSVHAEHQDDFTDYAQTTDSLYQMGSGAQDGVFTSLGASLFGWGIGLATGIAVLAAVLHQSKSSHNH